MAVKDYSERIVKMETKIDNIEETLKDHTTSLKELHGKFDQAILCKADRTEVNAVKKKINSFMIWALLLLIAIVGYLIDKLYITK